jgi:protein-L-isoaspartate O-methyltransferase
MTQVCQPKADDVTLEIGTGSGFQSALLSRIVKQAYSIEIIEPLGKAVGKIFAPLGYNNVHTRVGDGYYGWPEVQGGFDIIIVTCAAQYAPPDLFKQIKPGGRLVIPIGQPFKRGQVLYVYTKDAEGKIHSKRDMGVFFIPMTGAISKTPPPHGAPTAEAAPAITPASAVTEKPASDGLLPATLLLQGAAARNAAAPALSLREEQRRGNLGSRCVVGVSLLRRCASRNDTGSASGGNHELRNNPGRCGRWRRHRDVEPSRQAERDESQAWQRVAWRRQAHGVR